MQKRGIGKILGVRFRRLVVIFKMTSMYVKQIIEKEAEAELEEKRSWKSITYLVQTMRKHLAVYLCSHGSYEGIPTQ